MNCSHEYLLNFQALARKYSSNIVKLWIYLMQYPRIANIYWTQIDMREVNNDIQEIFFLIPEYSR